MSTAHAKSTVREKPAAKTSDQPHSVEWAQMDVFAERRLEGNMLAVFPDGTGLTSAEMQALSRETNLSETTFILPRTEAVEREQGVAVRIFTTQEELPFAGHPTLGTASWLWMHDERLRGADEIVLDLTVGKIPVRFTKPENGELGVFAEMQQRDPEFVDVLHDPDGVASALGIDAAELAKDVPIGTVSTGMPFCIVTLASVESLSKLRIPLDRAERYLRWHASKFFYVIAPVDKNTGATWRARMQYYNGEDPATGSAAGCCISFLVKHGLAKSGERIVMEQGVEIERRSRIVASAEKTKKGDVREVRVGGRTIPVATGRFFLP
jgi:trans-2,3-dihydro-3-hydroxyanthranilate isomerase